MRNWLYFLAFVRTAANIGGTCPSIHTYKHTYTYIHTYIHTHVDTQDIHAYLYISFVILFRERALNRYSSLAQIDPWMTSFYIHTYIQTYTRVCTLYKHTHKQTYKHVCTEHSYVCAQTRLQLSFEKEPYTNSDHSQKKAIHETFVYIYTHRLMSCIYTRTDSCVHVEQTLPQLSRMDESWHT